ncbi:glutamine amidotransferase [Chimaeribacter arupi]|uniref:glutamine amidotransferase n=1 Tax=Chimaeribacter arupi TaxID=2060066 RepID=UPI002712172F|nr:glutamine amidotransferase [Chimaeribacter arupi]WKZ92902.1 glutamine amidotransferase [Chimaeribacter arupi]
MTQPKPLLILQTGDAPEVIQQQHENYRQMFIHQGAISPQALEVVHLPQGERPGSPETYSGVIITGSGAMVTDRLAWSEWAAGWLRQAIEIALPVFGVCYGHQLLADALGGEVGYHPQGIECGTKRLERLPGAEHDPLCATLPAHFTANLIHSQTVLVPPPGAQVLARSEHDPHQILRFNATTFGTQFHPEFNGAVMKSYLRRQATLMPERQAELMAHPAEDTPVSQGLLQAFVAGLGHSQQQ